MRGNGGWERADVELPSTGGWSTRKMRQLMSGRLKGYVPVLVGSEKKMERVLIHTKQFRHPYFALLLEMAADEFGYEQQGILRIPCDVEYFRQVVDTLSQAKS